MTYVVLVILIALWALVLLPPYLKDRRASNRTFRSIQSGGAGVSSAQRFLPLQKASTGYATSAVSSPTGMRAPSLGASSTISAPSSFTSVPSSFSSVPSSNVVHLRPLEASPAAHVHRAPATSAAAYLEEAPLVDESALHQAWETKPAPTVGVPKSTAAARERRRQVLLGLTGLAFATLLLALFAGGSWVAAHVFVDVLMLGYVILLVRHRQLAVDRMTKVEPIRPPVSEQQPASVQLAPSYLLQSNTGS